MRCSRQPVATDGNGFGLFSRADPICDRLPPVATTGLHKGSIFGCQCWRHAEVSILGTMPGVSDEARRVKIMNANWVAGADGEDGRFELMIVTSDDRRHLVAPSPAAISALVALAEAHTVLVWDPADQTLIAANVRGMMPWTEEEATPTK
jgi:hypothetical protein